MAVNFDPCAWNEIQYSFDAVSSDGSLTHQFTATDSSSSVWTSLKDENKAMTALKVHSEAEKKRRERINAHLSTLKRMIPDSAKMDKAALLGKVIEQVKELKRKASEISKVSRVPRDINEVIVECHTSFNSTSTSSGQNIYIKVSISCDDRPDLFSDLIEAFHRLKLTTIRADMMSLGGRVHNMFILSLKNTKDHNVCISSLKEPLRQLLSRIVNSDIITSSNFLSKRRRVMQPY